jgi:hypothetical protein
MSPTYSDADFPDADHRPWHGGRDHLSRLGIALALLGMVALVASVVAIVQNNNTAHCLADFNASFAAAQRERADAADLDRQAIRQQRSVTREFNQVMIDAVTKPATAPEAQEKARTDFPGQSPGLGCAARRGGPARPRRRGAAPAEPAACPAGLLTGARDQPGTVQVATPGRCARPVSDGTRCKGARLTGDPVAAPTTPPTEPAADGMAAVRLPLSWRSCVRCVTAGNARAAGGTSSVG